MTKSEFVCKMQSIKKTYDKAREKEQELFDNLENQFDRLDLEDCITNAENASNIKEAIACYYQYGEYSPEQIWEEINMAYIAKS